MKNVKTLGRRLTAHYALIQSIYNMGYCCIMSFASVFLLSRGFTNAEVGITLTVAYALSIVCQPIIAAFADTTTKLALRTMVVIILLLITMLSFLLLITPPIMLPTALLYMLLLCFQSVQLSLVTSLSMEHINNGVPLNFSLARGIGSFAFAVLSFFLGFLVDDVGGWIIMPVNIGIGVVGIILIATFRKAKNRKMGAGAAGTVRASGLVEFSKHNAHFMAVVGSIALLFFSHVLINTYLIQIITNVGGSSSDMGAATALAGFLELPAMALFPFLLKKIPNASTIMKLSGVFLVVKTLITLFAPNVFWIDVAQCFQFFAFAMFIPSSVFYVNQVISEVDQVKGQAYMAMALGISGMIGNFLGGLMLDARGVFFMLGVGILVSIGGLIMLLVVDSMRVRRKQGVEALRTT